MPQKPARIPETITIRKVNSDYIATPRATALDHNLTHAQRGMLWEMLAWPADRMFSAQELICDGTSVNTMYKNLKALINAGYVDRTIYRNDQGKVRWVHYDVHECPQERNTEASEPLHKICEVEPLHKICESVYSNSNLDPVPDTESTVTDSGIHVMRSDSYISPSSVPLSDDKKSQTDSPKQRKPKGTVVREKHTPAYRKNRLLESMLIVFYDVDYSKDPELAKTFITGANKRLNVIKAAYPDITADELDRLLVWIKKNVKDYKKYGFGYVLSDAVGNWMKAERHTQVQPEEPVDPKKLPAGTQIIRKYL